MREPEERLWEILDEAELDLLITNGADGFPRVRPMTLLAYEEDGTLWFATSRSSHKVEEVRRNPKVSVFSFAEEAYAVIFGEAEIVDDPSLKKEFWEEEWEEFWDGPGDPDYVLLKVKGRKGQFYLVEEEELWETEFEPNGASP